MHNSIFELEFQIEELKLGSARAISSGEDGLAEELEGERCVLGAVSISEETQLGVQPKSPLR